MNKRIQKLLFSEYKDFEDMVLLESPFAQTTRDGKGIRQVQIGLTPSKLFVASDYLIQDDPTLIVDPEISTLELLSVLPIECVNISIFRKKRRNTIKAHFCNDQILYFELASPLKRDMFWNLWCEKIKFLSPHRLKSTASERSTEINRTKYEKNTERVCNIRNQSRKNRQVSSSEIKSERCLRQPQESTKHDESQVMKVNRFGAGVDENCVIDLFLSQKIKDKPIKKTREKKSNQSLAEGGREKTQNFKQREYGIDHRPYFFHGLGNANIQNLAEEGVEVWEKTSNVEHKRGYGIAPCPYYLHGLGTTNISSGSHISQMRKWSSEMCLDKTDKNPEFKFCVSKRQLKSSQSFSNLLNTNEGQERPIRRGTQYNYLQGNTLFWTPSISYCTKPPQKLYHDLQKHLRSVRRSLSSLGMKRKTYSIWSKTRKKNTCFNDQREGGEPEGFISSMDKFMKNRFEMNFSLSSWDFDSTALAYQITLIDRDLFAKITEDELETLTCEKNSTNTPNYKTIVEFSERLSNLVATEIIRVVSVKMRAKLISKFIIVADKLHRLHNMHSTKSVLTGLQNPALHRLKNTWDYLKRHHSSKYMRLYTLLKLYKDVRSRLYSALFDKFSRTMPYFPSVEHLTAAIMGRVRISVKRKTSLTSICSSEIMWSNSKNSTASETSLDNSRCSTQSDTINTSRYFEATSGNTCIKLEDCKESLMIWRQAVQCYDMIESPLVKEYLLKARYSEGYNLFCMSLNAEPPHNGCTCSFE